MQGETSDFAVLGLETGADRAAIDQAFRTLIKQYHPDRHAGDPARAIEITRAYRRLTARPVRRDDLQFNDRPPDRSVSVGWQIAGLLVAIGLLLVALVAGPFDDGFTARLVSMQGLGNGSPVANETIEPESFSAAIDDHAIADAAESALRDYGVKDEAALGAISAACHAALRRAPDLTSFDRCTAYDNAIIVLQDRDPIRDDGPFREVAVVRRHWSDAALFTRDYWAIDRRLDRIKLKVELLVAPRLPPPTVEVEPLADQRVDEPSGASVDEEPSSDSDQRKLSDVSNFSE